jgi:hypothetical protein
MSTSDTILEQGLSVLSKELGVAGMLQFLDEYKLRQPKIEDYASERLKWQCDDASIGELVKEAQEMEEKEHNLRLRA